MAVESTPFLGEQHYRAASPNSTVSELFDKIKKDFGTDDLSTLTFTWSHMGHPRHALCVKPRG